MEILILKIMRGIIAGLFELIGFVFVLGLTFIYNTLSWGLVLFKFWGWFVLPIFVTLPIITFVQAIGLVFVIGLFRSKYQGENIRDEFLKSEWESAGLMLIKPWVILFLGWLAYVIWLA